MAAHYEELVTGLTRRHDLSGGLVVDIGCGNASVLNMLMAAIPHSRGLGIDPRSRARRRSTTAGSG